MIVRCANCHTEFSLDDQQIGPEGATVRCSVCSYVFPVDPPPGAGEHPWQIRTVEDLLFTAADLATLRTWIAEGRLHPDDQVSRTGKHWLRLGDMPEFSSAFSGFGDLPQVFEELDAPTGGSALDELGPPPGFGETMPVVSGVDTDILVVRPEAPGDFEVPVTAHSAAVERPRGRPTSQPSPRAPAGPAPVPVLASVGGETSGPEPFPLAELGLRHDEPTVARPGVDESAVRMRPRPPVPGVSAIPQPVDDEPVEAVRRRPSRPTVRYGADEVHGPSSRSNTESVRPVVDDDPEARGDDREAHGADVRPTEAAVEQPREVSGRRRAAVVAPVRAASGPTTAAGRAPPTEPEPRPVIRSKSPPRDSPPREEAELESIEDEVARPRRRHRTFARELGRRPEPRRSWPLVAGLGLLAGVAVVFGVPSIRAKVMGLAGQLTATETFDPKSLVELEQARAAMASLDPVAVGRAEAALQGRLDEGTVPPPGVAEMKLVQVELLATRALERELGLAAGAPESDAPPDDVERATAVLGGVEGEAVIDRAHMRRVRALLRLAQGRPPAEILPLLPEDGSGELRQLVEAAPLWRDPSAPVPSGVIAGLQGLADKSALAELALALGYLRAGDEAHALQVVQAVLARVPAQPTALALQAKAGGGGVADATQGPAAQTGSGGPASEDEPGADGPPAPDDGADDPATPSDGADEAATPVRALSVDSLIERGCRQVESGEVSSGLELLRKARARRGSDLDLLLCTGQGHAKQGRAREALAAFEAALRVSPRFPDALAGAARASDKLGQTERAVGFYRRLLAERPGEPKALAYVQKHG